MERSIVLVTCDTATVNRLAVSATPATYLSALVRAGLVPVQVPTIPDPVALEPLLSVARGVLTTGARSNVHPTHYGCAETSEAEPFDPDRDLTAMSLIRAALERDLPLFCICRGLQELNVVRGGTLSPSVHDIEGRMDHRGADSPDMDVRFALQHDVALTPGGRVAQIIRSNTVKVNSVHRQAIDRLGYGLTVEGRAPDGTVEAVSVDGQTFAIGVQWHPEHFARTDAPSGALFDAFADAIRVSAQGRRAA